MFVVCELDQVYVQRWAMKQEMTAAPAEYKTWTERAGVEMCGETIWFSNVL